MIEPFIGHIQYFAFNYAPVGYALCNGAQLTIAQNQAMYSLLGPTYGGDQKTVFNLPDLRGRTIIGQGKGEGTASYKMGAKGGNETFTMTDAMLPVHNHIVINPAIGISDGRGLLQDPSGVYPAVPPNSGGNMYAAHSASGNSLGTPAVAVSTGGGGVPVSLLSPYVAFTCCIATSGIYPSRN